MDDSNAWRFVQLTKILTRHQDWYARIQTSCDAYDTLKMWFEDEDIRLFLQFNRYQDVLWFNKETFEELLNWMTVIQVIDEISKRSRSSQAQSSGLKRSLLVIKKLLKAMHRSNFQVDLLLEQTYCK
jgi:hypothetical protein